MLKKSFQTGVISMCLIAAAIAPLNAHAWAAAGPRGVAAGGWGGGVAHGAYGGSAAWSHGSGVAYGPHGGEAAWSHGTGYAHGAYGGTAAWSHGAYYHPVPVYRPPVYYGGGYSGGQVAGAAMVGMAVGTMAGAAMASSHSQPTNTTVVVQQPASTPAATTQMPIGSQVTVLPGNCGSATIRGVEYYECGPNWFKPYFGNSSVYYQVVAAPY